MSVIQPGNLERLTKMREIGAEGFLFWTFAGLFFSIPLGTSPPLIFGGLAILIWLLSGMVLTLRRYYRQSWFWPVLAFMVLPWLGLLYSPDPGGFGIDYAEKTHYWVLCLALASLSFFKLKPDMLIQAFLAGVAVNAVVGVLQLLGVVEPKEEFFTGLARGYNTLAAYLILSILMSAFYFREVKRGWKRIGLLLMGGLYLFHLTIIKGRAGYVTFIVLFPLALKTVFPRLGNLKIFLVCLCVIGAMFAHPRVRQRVEFTIEQLQYHVTVDQDKAWGKEYTAQQDRFYMWRGAIEIYLEHPVIGVGTGGFPIVLKKARGPNDPIIAHPHNSLLYVAASYGTIGIVAFVWIFAEMLKNAWRERETDVGFFILCGTLILIVNGIFNTTILDSGGIILFAVVAGLQRALIVFKDEDESKRGRSPHVEKKAV